ncbi:hypothetical protein N9356_01185 [Porticoccaceae bacterium]|nr:hypothetical protein [Porticoccaceae bacterium]
MTYIINLFCLFRNLLIIVSLTTLLNNNVNAVVENPGQANEIIIGDWQIAPKAYAFYVGPNQGSSIWWFNELSHVSKRSCFFDDIFRFNNDGSFENVMDGLTWLEDWQNPAGDSYCGTPQAPYNGSTAGQWTINSQASSLTISGVGAHVGLPKVINGSEIDNTNNAPSSVTYTISELTESQMTLDISVGFGWWGFELIKVSTDSDNDGYTDAVDAFPSNPNYHLDSDNDGMANSWEQQYGLNYLNASDATSDLDNDNILAIDEFLNGTVPSASLDIDGNGEFDALTDGLLILRSFFGIENDSLTSGAIGNSSIYSSATEIQTRISSIHSSLDIDNNGQLDALTDGLIILRYLFEMRSNSLIDGVISPTSNRSNLEDILTYFDTLIPADSDNDGVLDLFDLYPNDPTKIADEDTSNPPEPEPITVPYDTPSQGLLDGTSIWQLPNSPDGDRPDQCWLAVGSDADGEIYISGHDHSQNSMMYRLFQEDQTLRYIGDARTASQAVNNWQNGETAEKFHTRPIHHNGQVYVATLDSSSMNNSYLNTRGFHWYGYDIEAEAFSDLSANEPNGVGGDHLQIVTIQKDSVNNLLYGMTIPENKLVQYDIETGQTTVLGKPSAWQGYFYSNRYMWVDSRGRVYISGGSSRNQWNQGESANVFDHIWFYDPDTGFGELQNFALQGPNAMEVGQWERSNERLYVSDDQGHIYRFTDANSSWEFLGRPGFSSSLKTWIFQLSADEEKIYIGLSDGNQPNAIYEYDIATGTSFELLKISDLDNQAAVEDFITGYDSWDSQGSFYISNFSMYDGDNTFMLGINPVRIKVAKGFLPELVQVTAQAGNNGITINRSGQTTTSLEVLYAINGYDSANKLVAKTHGTLTLSAGQPSLAIDPDNLSQPQDSSIIKREFIIIPDGNDYISGEQRRVEFSN